MALTIARANQLVAEMCAAAGIDEEDMPIVSDEGLLTDGNWSETASLESESAFRVQLANWIATEQPEAPEE